MDKDVHILVVEDDEDINKLLCKIIRTSGYLPYSAYSGTEALIYLDRQKWDMILLDLMLPGMTGEGVLEKITKQSAVPVIIISAKLEQQTKIDTLRMGADDYITKPFDIEEVSARLEAHLRRSRRTIEPPTKKELKHKDICVDIDAKKVWVNRIEISLTAREYAILVLLLSSPNKVFTKANLFQSVWNEAFLGDDNTINVHISNLRSKFSKANPQEEYIETIWGMGYRLKT